MREHFQSFDARFNGYAEKYGIESCTAKTKLEAVRERWDEITENLYERKKDMNVEPTQHNGFSCGYELLPYHMQEGIKDYIEHGRPVGDFLRAVITNNLAEAAKRADDLNAARFIEWGRFLHDAMPLGSWGSAAQVDTWQHHRGLAGVVPYRLGEREGYRGHPHNADDLEGADRTFYTLGFAAGATKRRLEASD
ncbi:MAG: hypothetical protein ACREB3_05335 [Burkholderiales bacterium]